MYAPITIVAWTKPQFYTVESRARLLRTGLLREEGLTPCPDLEPCLRIDATGVDSANADITDFYVNGPWEE